MRHFGHFSLFAFLVSPMIAVAAAFSAAAGYALRAIDYLLDVMTPGADVRLVPAGPGMALDIGGSPLDASLLTRIRHESRTARIGAPRHT